jgi:4-amino-4-deoxy-L-arabinose transferase-like glycosyltransferase
LIFALLVFPYFLNLGVSALWDSNEAFYAETPREMLERRDFIFPTFNHEPRVHKPPLTYWLIALSYRLFGISEFSARIPSALAVCLLLGFLIYFLLRNNAQVIAATASSLEVAQRPAERWARLPADDHAWAAAILAASFLATTPRFFISARRLAIDCLLTVFVTISLLLVYWALHAEQSETIPAGRWRPSFERWMAAGLFAGLAFLTKGPIALVLLAITTVLFCWQQKKLPRSGLWFFFAAFLLISVPYYLVLWKRSSLAVLYNFFFTENIGRYTVVTFSPWRGPLYYLRVLLADAFPWSWFLPVAFYLRKFWAPSRNALVHFCWIWFLVVVLFFSLSHTKEEYYILPAYPALAILIAHFFVGLKVEKAASKVLWATALCIGLGLVIAGLFFLWASKFLPLAVIGWWISGLLALGAAGTLVLFWRGAPSAAAGLLIMLLLLTMATINAAILPALETLRPTRPLTAEIARSMQPADHAGYFRLASPSMSFYLRQHISELFHLEDLEADLDKPGRSWLLMEAEQFQALPSSLQNRLEVIDSAAEFPTAGKRLWKIRSSTDLPLVLLVRER